MELVTLKEKIKALQLSRWRWRQRDPAGSWCPAKELHRVTAQRALTWIFCNCLYSICSLGQVTRGGHPAWGLGEEVTSPHRKKSACYEMLRRASELGGETRGELL